VVAQPEAGGFAPSAHKTRHRPDGIRSAIVAEERDPSRVTQVTEFRNASRYPLSISSAKTLFRLGPIAPGRFTMTTMLALIALWIALSVKLVNDACDRGDRRQDLSRS